MENAHATPVLRACMLSNVGAQRSKGDSIPATNGKMASV
jgi:hypothetical protein